MTHHPERIERELLSLAAEDWYSLSEGLSAVKGLGNDNASNVQDTARNAIQSLLDRGWIRLARLNFATNDESHVSREDEAQVLGDEASWVGPDDQKPWAIVFGATEAGEREYFGGDRR